MLNIIVAGVAVPPQIFEEIFQRIDCRQTLILSCPLVCRCWNEILSLAGFWIGYMKYHRMVVPPRALVAESILNLRKICLKQPFERNLIDNPSGEKDFEGWIINADGGDGFNVEHPPRGLTVVLKEVIPTSFSTSYGYCYKYCCIDLWQEGID
ncbi:F-box only protein 2, partial [Toxocara canis]